MSYLEYEFTTKEALVAGRLTSIKVELRENRGDALIRLLVEEPIARSCSYPS